MTLLPWKKITEETVFSTPRWNILKTEFELPAGGVTVYHSLHSSGGVQIIALRDDNRILMQKQYRPLLGKFRLEFPAGKIDNNESPLETAKRELSEEAKLSANNFEFLGSFEPIGGTSNHLAYSFLATDLFERALPADEGEEFEDHWLTVQEIDELIAAREITDGWALAGWSLFRSRKTGI